jgi:hypothetical protein
MLDGIEFVRYTIQGDATHYLHEVWPVRHFPACVGDCEVIPLRVAGSVQVWSQVQFIVALRHLYHLQARTVSEIT